MPRKIPDYVIDDYAGAIVHGTLTKPMLRAEFKRLGATVPRELGIEHSRLVAIRLLEARRAAGKPATTAWLTKIVLERDRKEGEAIDAILKQRAPGMKYAPKRPRRPPGLCYGHFSR